MMRNLILFTLAVAAMLLPHEASSRRIPFTLPTNLPTGTPSKLSCESVLVKANPDNYPHCYCVFGSWSPFIYKSSEANSACPSGRRHVLESTRRRLSPKCNQQPQMEVQPKYICEPTLKDKAKQLGERLDLASRVHLQLPNNPNLNKPPNNLNPSNPRNLNCPTCFSHNRSTSSPLWYNTFSVQPNLRSRRQAGIGLTVPCPASQSEKRVCADIIAQSCRRGRRSKEEPQDMKLLADFIQQQDHIYSNKIDKRQAGSLPETDRNVFFVVDSSGSITPTNYIRVLNVLADFAGLFCGEAAIGMLTYSWNIELEFCPTCLQSLDYTDYISEVKTLIKSARHHRSVTNTGEMVKCLRHHVLPSSDCRLLNKKTQIVFFTDGRANGCTQVPPAIAELERVYPNLEVYAIGVGDIRKSGVVDLLTANYDPSNIFNFENIDHLEGLLAQIKQQIASGTLKCSPVSFGK